MKGSVTSTVPALRALLRAAALVLVALAWAGVACAAGEGGAQRLRMGNTPFLGSAPIYVALDKGYFAAEGVQIDLVENSAGQISLKQLLEGDLDLAMTAELPLAYSILDPKKYTPRGHADFVMLADLIVSRVAASGGIARRDLGVAAPADLRGKRVAVPVGTTLDLYLDLFLSAHGLRPDELQIVDMPENRHLDALMRGEVAAIFSFRHSIVRAQQLLGNRALPLSNPVNFMTNWVLVTSRALPGQQPKAVQGVLRALDRAATFIAAEPTVAREIFKRRSGLPAETVDRIWGEHEYRIALSESLARNLETEMRWILRRQGRTGQRLPNLLLNVDPGPVRALGAGRDTLGR